MSKKKAAKAKEDFIMVYNSYMKLRSKNVGADEIILLGLIGNLSQTMDCIATNEYLATMMNVTDRTIRRYIANLQADNLITVEQKDKAKSHRTLLINHDIIKEKCQYGGQGCPCEEPKTEFNSEGVDKVVHVGGQGCPSRVDSSGFENADNASNNNPFQNLIEKKIEKRIEKNIQPASQSVAPADAVAKPSATADVEGASHRKEKPTTNSQEAVLTIMYKLVEKRIISVDGKLMPYTKEYDDELMVCVKDMTEGVKVNSVYDVINHLNTYLN